MKKVLCMLLAVCMLLGLLSACGTASAPASVSTQVSALTENSSLEETTTPVESAVQDSEVVSEISIAEESEETPDEELPVVEYPVYEEPETFTIWTGSAPDLSEVINSFDDYLVIRELEKVTGVHFDATLVSFMAASEQFALMVASGDYTEIVNSAVDNYTGSIDQAIEEEFLLPLNELISENMPNLQTWIKTYPEMKAQLSSVEGNIAAFPKLYQEPSDVTSGGMLRLDWLEDLNLSAPTTYDELHDVLVAFRDEKGATEPLLIPAQNGVQAGLINGFNIDGGYYQIDNVIYCGTIQPEFKEYLTLMHQWYSEGLVSDYFLTSQGDGLTDLEKVLNGTSGVWYGSAAQSITNIVSMSSDPNIRVTGITNVTTDGSVAHTGEVGVIYDSNTWSITPVCHDPEGICKVIDYMYSEAGVLLANFGVEGETFNYDENGTPVLTELVTNNPDYAYSLALNIYTCDRMTPIPFVIDEAKARQNYSDDQLNAIEVWNNATDGLYNIPRNVISLSSDETEEYNALYNDIETYLDESIVKFITGDLSLDEFDNFVNTLLDMGIEECTAIQQVAYNRYLAEQ